MQILSFAKNAEKIGKYIGLPVEKIQQDLQLKSKTAVINGIQELIKADILEKTGYQELYILKEKNIIPEVCEGNLTVDITFSLGNTEEVVEEKRKRGRKPKNMEAEKPSK